MTSIFGWREYVIQEEKRCTHSSSLTHASVATNCSVLNHPIGSIIGFTLLLGLEIVLDVFIYYFVDSFCIGVCYVTVKVLPLLGITIEYSNFFRMLLACR